ncbi:helicase [Pseudoclavibacter sp. RFBI5]|uniref:helicase-related protein n=1 Tax=Pseudoclavibacter sp. RFBI5 TaxID=2080578 RepID=UPI000CE8610E|nr:helicase-related protein [Pseudoclavibacter sp. RFBI5]PPG04452.1 helicase [Pseudoclavibacter sp. RFBI5]
MSAVDANAVMDGLKGFQRDAVAHVIDRFYGPDSAAASGRFLVADETGLGKSIIARGVVARSIEELERRRIPRIDIVYVCSNQDLARQNLKRLNVTGETQIEMTTRLTLLAKQSKKLDGGDAGNSKVNLVSFTPGTSFSGGGWRQGNADERAMLAVMLDHLTGADAAQRRATRVMLTGTVKSTDAFARRVDWLGRELGNAPDAVITTAFHADIEQSGELARFEQLRDEMSGLRRIPSEIWNRVQNSIAKLRHALGKAGVDTLQPDLIILDEFQRFKHLLDPESGEAGELADALFQHPAAKVLLLSATPYKPFTNADDDEDHSADFLATIRFLMGGQVGADAPIADALASYRHALTSGGDAPVAATAVGHALRPVMTRSERPALGEREDLVQVRHLDSQDPTAADVLDWVTLQRLGGALQAPIDLEYWKSIPYFSNFMDGYKPAARLTAARDAARNEAPVAQDAQVIQHPGPGRAAEFGSGASTRSAKSIDPTAIAAALAATRSLDPDAMRRFAPVDLGNSHLRALADDTVGRGWWQLLWVPPTMPYVTPGVVYAPFADGSVTKQVIFSAWSAVPGAVAGLLSYEAERRMAGERSLFRENSADGRKAVAARRLAYSLSEGERPAAMSTLALFWPHPALASIGDPLAGARASGSVAAGSAGTLLGADELLERVGRALRGLSSETGANAYFAYPGAVPSDLASASASSLIRELHDPGDDGEGHGELRGIERGSKGLTLHVAEALDLARTAGPATCARATSDEVTGRTRRAVVDPSAGGTDLARLAAFGPGNAALGAIRSVAGPLVTEGGAWLAAFALAEGIRSLFNRPESIALLETLYGRNGEGARDPDETRWRRVLDYCADGNLRAVLDEYLFQLHSENGGAEVGDDELLALARRAVEAMTLRPARYVAHDTTLERGDIPLTARFALRYGGKQNTDADATSGARQGEVRGAFNSPFAPFVLASTSVGQEGIDFHWWSHSVIHWNLPSNPVDFEQREGRVNRFAGHAVRKNVAAAHWVDALASTDARAWRAAFEAAEGVDNGLGEFSPWWMYPGDARIHRVIAQYPLSRDAVKYERLRKALTMYRLTLGQPRQEDMLELLAKRGADAGAMPTIDLRPPGLAGL